MCSLSAPLDGAGRSSGSAGGAMAVQHRGGGVRLAETQREAWPSRCKRGRFEPRGLRCEWGMDMGRRRGLAAWRAVACGVTVCLAGTAFVGSTNALAASRSLSSPKTPPGYHTVTLKKAGFSIAVPDTWLALDPKSKSYVDNLDRVAAANPKLASLMKQGAGLVASNAQFFAADQTSTGSSANLVVIPLPIDKSELSNPTGVQTVLKASFQGQVPDLATHKTKVAGTPALLSTGTLHATRPDGTPVTVYVSFYLVSSKIGVLDFDFSTTDNGQQDRTVQTMLHSLKLLR